MKSRKSCPQNANIKVSLYNLNTTYVIHKYTFCENFKATRQVEGKIIHSFKHLMGFKHLNKHSIDMSLAASDALMYDADVLLISDMATTANRDKTCFRHIAEYHFLTEEIPRVSPTYGP